MKSLFEIRGEISVSMGEGYISSFEASTLKAGDVVLSTRLVGDPCTVLLNGRFLSTGWVVVIDDAFAVILFDMPEPERFGPTPSNPDDVVEILPTRIVLSRICATLDELRGVGPGTFVVLGDHPADGYVATLDVAGTPLAEGEIVIVDDQIGFRAKKILTAPKPETNARSSGYLLADPARGVEAYDFKKPRLVKHRQMERIAEIHRFFLRSLAAGEPAFSAWSLVGAEERVYAELCEEAEAAGLSFLRVLVAPWRAEERERGFFAGAGAVGRKAVFQAADARVRVADEFVKMVEKNRRREPGIIRKPMFVLHAKRVPSGGLGEKGPGRDAFVSSLRGAWKSYVDLNLQPEDAGENCGDLKKYLPPGDIVVAVTFAEGGGGGGRLLLVYPHITLEPVLGLLE